MKKATKWLSLVLVLVMVLSLAACSGTPAAPSAAPAQTAAPATGGTLTLVNGNVMKIVGFPLASGTPEQFAACPAIETLGRYNDKGDIVGWLAKDIKTDPAGLKIVLTLQQGVKYHDGSDFDAKAVCDVWDIYKANGYAARFSNIDSYSATGPNEVTVKLKSWAADTVSRLCIDAGWMISPAAFKQYGLEGLYTKIIGTGPFTMKSFSITEGIEYTKNPNYWIKGQPYLDGMKFIFAKDLSTATNIMKSGGAQVDISVDQKTFSDLMAAGFKRIGVDSCVSPTLTGVYFASGNKNDAISNLDVRRAFCSAIDVKSIIKAFTYGTSAYTNQLGYAGSKEYNDKVAGYPYDVNKAKEYLKKAGYSDTNKPTVTLSFATTNGKDIMIAIQGYLQAAGFNVKIDEVDAPTMAERMIVGRTAPYTSVAFWNAPTTSFGWTRYFSTTPTTMVVNSVDLKANGVIDTYNKAMYSTNAAEQKDSLMQLQKLCIDDFCLFFPLFTTPNLYIGTDKVKDSGITMTYVSIWTPETAKLAK